MMRTTVGVLLAASSVVLGVTPGELETYSTIRSIGIEWDVSDDNDHDAVCPVQYRAQGDSAWKDALPLFRVDFNGFDMLAGSIMFLEPDTVYEVTLELSDPDGGGSNCTIAIATRAVPALPTGGNEYHVVPGSGGGTGTSGDPFQGIDAAQAVAQPGDVFLLHPGNYGGRIVFNVSGATNNHVVWKGAQEDKPVLEGVRVAAHYVWLEGLQIEQSADNNNALLTTSIEPEGVVITRNVVTNCHYGVRLNHGGKNWYITDNVIVGDTLPSSGSFSGEGVELEHSSGHVVAYNRISYVADGISYPHSNCDIYGNEIFDVSDDGIEPDYGYRIFAFGKTEFPTRATTESVFSR